MTKTDTKTKKDKDISNLCEQVKEDIQANFVCPNNKHKDKDKESNISNLCEEVKEGVQASFSCPNDCVTLPWPLNPG